jgi:cytochrome c oxidase accessory protein FixG
MPVSLLSPKRRTVQWLTTLLLLVLPFIRVGGKSLLRLDGPTRTLLFFGTTIRIEEFYLILLVVLIFTLGFLFVTMVFGRVWCGWFCPQTTLSEVAEFIARTTAAWPPVIAYLARHGGYVCLSFLVASNLIWYFIVPDEYFPRLLSGSLGPVAEFTLGVTMLLVYTDLTLIRRKLCKTICPYGRLQLLTMDRHTLTLAFDDQQATRCINCGACVRACPMGIDIRAGLQVECINCGSCLDACRRVMGQQVGGGLIRYTFGRREEGGGRPLTLRTALLAAAILVLSGILLHGAIFRPTGTIKIQRNSAVQVRHFGTSGTANFFTAYVENRTSQDGVFDLLIEGGAPDSAELLGPVHRVSVPANDNRRLDFLVKTTKPALHAQTLTIALRRDGRVVSRQEISIADH